MSASNDSSAESVSFGPFSLCPRARVLCKAGNPVTVGSRALDILIALVDRAGEVVNHRELISRAWRGLVVDAGNLRVQVTYLRRSLGDGEHGARYIANVPGQGYSFVAPVSLADFGERQRMCSRNRRLNKGQPPNACEGDLTASTQD